MIKFVGVLPYVHKPYFDECWATMKPSLRDYVYPVDNTVENTGVAESWNRGIYFMKKYNADWLIIISAAIRFGQEEGYEPRMDAGGGLDVLRQIEKHQYANIIHFAKRHIPEQNYDHATNPHYNAGVFYWHLTAVRSDVFERIGYFDPNFHPIYYEDTDFDIRFNKAYKEPKRIILPIDAESAGLRHAVEKSGVKPDTDKLIAYFATKWGRHPSAAELGEYSYPFNDKNNSLAFFPPAHGRLWNE